MTSPAPVVAPGAFLTLHYRLAGPDGGDVINTFNEGPATLTIGSGELAPALEARLMGMAEGTRTVIDMAPGEAFGQRNPEMIQRVAVSMLRKLGDTDESWDVGDVVQFPTPDGKGAFAGVVRDVDPAGQWLVFDFNHPLAGESCTFEVQIIGVL